MSVMCLELGFTLFERPIFSKKLAHLKKVRKQSTLFSLLLRVSALEENRFGDGPPTAMASAFPGPVLHFSERPPYAACYLLALRFVLE